MKKLKKVLERMVGEREEENLCIEWDFDARIGREGRKYKEREDDELWRNSKDKIINSEGKELLGMLEERGWEIGNGNTWEDERKESGHIQGHNDRRREDRRNLGKLKERKVEENIIKRKEFIIE